MFEVAVDKRANLITVTYAANVGPEESQQCKERVVAMLGQMQEGFRLLVDMRSLGVMDLACAPFIEQTMDACDCAGVKMVVRIIPDPRKDIGLNIMSLFHYSRGVRIATCKSLEEARSTLGTWTAPTAAS
jgi:hypothetical protein